MEPHVKGGMRTRAKHCRVCSECGQLIGPTGYYASLGSSGGATTLKRYGVEHMRQIGRLGGRPRNDGSRSPGDLQKPQRHTASV
jgi:hypothetical protein